MTKPHPDSPAIDRVGTKAIMDHFVLTRQAVSYWRKNGVPKRYRKKLALLGNRKGHKMPEMNEPRKMIAAVTSSPSQASPTSG